MTRFAQVLLAWIWLTALCCDVADWAFWAKYRVPVSILPIIVMWVVLMVMIYLYLEEDRISSKLLERP